MKCCQQFNGLSLHILLLKCEGFKFPRNPNSHALELYCGTHFYGPLVVGFNKTIAPYALQDFIPSYLEKIKEFNLTDQKSYPTPLTPQSNFSLQQTQATGKIFYTYNKQVLENKKFDITLEGEICLNLENYLKTLEPEVFYMYRFKTKYCPQINIKHDWSHCIYAHRPQDSRYSSFYSCPNYI
jgi:hypothetical protein